MTRESDQTADQGSLSATAQRMQALRDDVLDEWAKRLRQNVKEAEQLSHPILINTFPMLYNNLAEAISPDFPRTKAQDGTTVASEHGGERARLTNYNAQAVISEYQLLRWTIFDVLQMNDVHLDDHELFIINASIDDAIRESANAFSLAQAALRERFVATLTHDLRNPLSTANMAAELIKRSTDLDKIRNLAGTITDNLFRMDAMIQDLLDSIIFQSGERLRLRLAECDLLALAQDVCDQFASRHGARFACTGDAVTGWWDREVLKRAIENLVGNAVKYGAADTPVRVNIESTHGRVVLSVHNEGDPIPPDQIEGVFQVFRRAAAARDGQNRGWGIGLPFVRSAAESHGGSVGTDSAAERGTTFTISIPRDARPFQDAPTLGGS